MVTKTLNGWILKKMSVTRLLRNTYSVDGKEMYLDEKIFQTAKEALKYWECNIKEIKKIQVVIKEVVTAYENRPK